MALAPVAQEELRAKLDGDPALLILDLRGQADYDSSFLRIRGAVRVHPNDISSLSHQSSHDKEVIVYCRFERDAIGLQAVGLLRDQGFEKVYPLDGGFQEWLSAGLEVEPK